MKSFSLHHRWQSLMAAFLIPLLAFILACGPGEQPTPTPTPTATPKPAATPTVTPAAAPVATATPTRPGPTATPTPTTVAVATPTPTPGKQPKRGGMLRQVTASFTPNFDIQLLSASPDFYTTNSKMYSNLLLNYTEEVVECDTCSEWHLENNGKTMVFTLIKGIKFHTGQELTSADVKYSLRMIIGDVDGIVSPRSGVIKEYIESIETPDKYTVRINLLRPSPYMSQVLANGSSVIFRDGTTREGLKTAPAGSGPFLVDKIVSGSSWTLVRNPNYFKPGQPYLDKVEVTTIADEATRMAAFLTGRWDLHIRSSPIAEAFLPSFQKLADQGRINLQPTIGGNHQQGVWMVVSKPPFDNLKLRQAVNLALDRKRIGSAVFGNLPVHPQLLVYTKDSPWSSRPESEIWDVLPGWGTGAKKAQEIEQAKQLVKEAGYPNGIDTEMYGLITAPWPLGSEESAKQLAPVGIRGKLQILQSVALAERFTNLTYTMLYYPFAMITRDPDEIVGQYWITGAVRNPTGYSNPQVDKLYVQMSSELDFAKRKQLLRQLEDIIVLKDVGYAAVQTNDGHAAWWKRVQGVTIGHPHIPAGLMRADRLWIEE
ncbi:MAG: ABC transporter substrate-binding protein [Dehalococcoidia bacterium]|nr:ABC transporter substrate-binding protein [Dehalococcoidia bacterium]